MTLPHSKIATLDCALLGGVECVLRSLPVGVDVVGGGCAADFHKYAQVTHIVEVTFPFPIWM